MTRRNEYMHTPSQMRKRRAPAVVAPVEEPQRPFDLVGAIMEYEQGDLSARGTMELFSHLIKTGTAWSLQGSYGRAAVSLIEQGFITKAGVITQKTLNRLEADGQ